MKLFLPAFLLLVLPLFSLAENFDVLIRNGLVVDGSGNPGYHADVAVKDGHIAAIGKIDGPAKEEIDATGLVVAPGFIDVHTHADDVADFPRAENFLRMGVTSIVVGNCGSSDLDIAKLFTGIEKKTVSINVASLIGHNSDEPQLPTTMLVTPMRTKFSARGKSATSSACVWTSMKPGAMTRPVASISSLAVPSILPMAAMRPSFTAILA